MKLNYAALGVLLTAIVIPLLAWGISVEVRLSNHASVESVSQRVENLENVLLPVLVEYKLQQLLKTEAKAASKAAPRSATPADVTSAKKWANSQIPPASEKR